MFPAPRWRPTAAVVAFAAAAVALVGPAPKPVAAEPPAAADWTTVPADAAVFAHVNVAELWDSKIGETFRAAKAAELEKGLAEIQKVTGVTPDMLQTATVVYPSMKSGGDFQSVALLFTFRKPYDRAAIVKGQTERNKGEKAKVTDQDGVIAYDAGPRDKVRIVAKDPTRIGVFINLDEKTFAKPKPADGPLTPAFKAAAGGATAVIGLNLAAFPDEIRGDDLPAEGRAFQPLLRSDAVTLTGKLAGNEVNFDLRVRNQDKAKTGDAEKSLAAGVTFFQTLQRTGVEQLAKSTRDEEKALLPLVQEAGEFLKTVRVSATDTEAVATATAKADLPYTSFLQAVFGGKLQAGSARAVATNNLKQIGLAMHNYHDTYNGFPPTTVVSKKGKPMLSWRVMVLPFLEHEALYKQFKLDEPWDSAHNKAVLDKNPMPRMYAIPGVTKDGDKTTHFQVFVNNGAMFDPIQPTKIASVTDGTSNTVMVATAATAVPWTKPDDIPFDPAADPHKFFLFWVDDGSLFAFADGSVRFIKKSVSSETLRAVITKSGGEVISNDF